MMTRNQFKGSPLAELEFRLQRIENRLIKARDNYKAALERKRLESTPSFFGFRLTSAAKPPTKRNVKKATSFFAMSTSTPTSPSPSSLSPLVHGMSPQKLRRSQSASLRHEDFKIPPPFMDNSTAEGHSHRVFATTNNKDENGRNRRRIDDSIQFIDVPEAVAFVEDLRRIAELVVVGENYVTNEEKKRIREMERSKKQWNMDRDLLGDVAESSELDDHDADDVEQSPELADLFDLFFERNTLATMVDMLTGIAFDIRDEEDDDEEEEEEGDEKGEKDKGDDTAEADASGDAAAEKVKEPKREKPRQRKILLPPIAIATQAIQSISILIQNVSRATSLYILLSNDHINALIALPLKWYEKAEKHRREVTGDESRSIFASVEISELSTHFVTLLKSLALRMNAETLQFFLQYPEEDGLVGDAKPISSPHLSSQGKDSEGEVEVDPASGLIEGLDPESLKVHFPLYDRALDFCAAHHENFVRVTAMNVCLNTLRLTTVQSTPIEPKKPEQMQQDVALERALTGVKKSVSSPNADLHNVTALPFRERLAIAQHTCIPSRVEKLCAPIFAKLSERWTSLDEALKAMDAYQIAEETEETSGGGKLERAKEKVRRERLVKAVRACADDLQDELMLLEDVFKVGLTVLNEQLIEMMLATFVYPLLMQPLILFSRRYTNKVTEAGPQVLSSPAAMNHPFGPAFSGDYREAQIELRRVTGPTKTAMFTIAAVFQTMSNPPLIRLLYTALFHPLSPDSAKVPTVRTSLRVAEVGKDGRGTIRVDGVVEGSLVGDSRETYPFGTKEFNRKPKSGQPEDEPDKEACVFVLSPALAEVLEFRGQNYDLVARTRSNSYRNSLLQCLEMPTVEFASLRVLTVCAVEAALARLDPKLSTDILFGVEMKSFSDDIPMDERNLDSINAHQEHDRDLGGSASHASRFTLAQKAGSVGSNLVGQFTSAVCSAILHATRSLDGKWGIGYDPVATRALLLAGKGHVGGLISASRTLENRWTQAAAFLAQTQENIEVSKACESSSEILMGAPDVDVPDFEEQLARVILDAALFGIRLVDKNTPATRLSLLKSANATDTDDEECPSTEVGLVGDFRTMTERSVVPFLEQYEAAEIVDNAEREILRTRTSVSVILQSDAFVSLLKDLAATGGVALQSVDLAGVAVSSQGSFMKMMNFALSKKLHAPISPRLTDCVRPVPMEETNGTTMQISGYTAIPCVCEAPAALAYLFTDGGSGVEAEGVTWQSLYIVFKEQAIYFAQPIQGGSVPEGRVLGSCRLEQLVVEKDDSSMDNGSPARRLMFTHVALNQATPPALFLYDTLPADASKQKAGSLNPSLVYMSRLDLWCENQRAVDYAHDQCMKYIFAARALRGRRLQHSLAPSLVSLPT